MTRKIGLSPEQLTDAIAAYLVRHRLASRGDDVQVSIAEGTVRIGFSIQPQLGDDAPKETTEPPKPG